MGRKNTPRRMSGKSFEVLAAEVEVIDARLAALSDKLAANNIKSIEVPYSRSAEVGLERLIAFVEGAEKAWRDKANKIK